MWKVSKFAIVSISILGMSALTVSDSRAEVAAYFGRATDTIKIPGFTSLGNQATFEFRVLMTHIDSSSRRFELYDEWTDSFMDHHVGMGGRSVGVYMYPLSANIPAPGDLLSKWHDVAYVFDGQQQRIYIDGTLCNAIDSPGHINSGWPTSFTLGANTREGGQQSFEGFLSAVRVSNVARYYGSTYKVPSNGNYSTDSQTQLLYRFSKNDFNGTVRDLSGNGHDGQMGIGFSSATSPSFADLPSNVDGVFYGPQIRQDSADTADVIWHTETATPSTVVYAPAGQQNLQSVTDSTLTYFHVVTVKDLNPNTTYNLAIRGSNYTSPSVSLTTANYAFGSRGDISYTLVRNLNGTFTLDVTISTITGLPYEAYEFGAILNNVKSSDFADIPVDLGPVGYDSLRKINNQTGFTCSFPSSIGARGTKVSLDIVTGKLVFPIQWWDVPTAGHTVFNIILP